MVYIEAARSIASGTGFHLTYVDPPYPLSHWAPLYALVLAAPTRLGIDPRQAARVVNSVCLVFVVLLMGVIASRYCGKTVGILAALLALLSKDLMDVYSQALSEALFVPLLLASIFMLLMYLRSGSLWHLLILSGFIGLATLTRYAGMFLFVNAPVVTALLGRHRHRISQSLLAATVSIMPISVWVVHNIVTSTEAFGARRIVFHSLQLHHLYDLLATVTLWFVPGSMFRPILCVMPLGCGVIIMLLVVKFRRLKSGSVLLLQVSSITFITYICFVLANICFADATTPLDERILAPVYPAGGLILAAGLAVVLEILLADGVVWYCYLPAFFVCTLLVVGALRTERTLSDARVNGVGYQTAYWSDDGIKDYVRNLSKENVIYSDDVNRTYYLTGVVCRHVPQKFSPVTMLTDDRKFGEQITALASPHHIIVILWPDRLRSMGFPSLSELQKIGFRTVFRSPKGAYIYAD
jgi:hypothetical protein